MTSASACAVERTPNFVARSGTSVVTIVALGSCLVSSSGYTVVAGATDKRTAGAAANGNS